MERVIAMTACLLVAALAGSGGCEPTPDDAPVVRRARALAGHGDPSLTPAGVAMAVLRAANAGEYERVNRYLTADYAARRAWEFRGNGGLGAWCNELTGHQKLVLTSLDLTRNQEDGDHAQVILRGQRGDEDHGWGFHLVRRDGAWLVDG